MTSPADVAGQVSLLCRLQSYLGALPIEHVIETMRPLAVEPLAGAPPFVRGVAIVRGAPVPVVDVSLLVAGSSVPAGRFVSIRTGRRRAVLAVQGVVGVRQIALPSLRELPPLLGDSSTAVVSAMGT